MFWKRKKKKKKRKVFTVDRTPVKGNENLYHAMRIIKANLDAR